MTILKYFYMLFLQSMSTHIPSFLRARKKKKEKGRKKEQNLSNISKRNKEKKSISILLL